MARALLLLLAVLVGCADLRLERPLVAAPPADVPAPPLVRLWERDADAAFGPGAPVVGRDYVAVGTRRGEVVVLDARTGARTGAMAFGESVEGALAVSPDGARIFVPVARGRAGVVAYDVRTGARAWEWRGGEVRAGLALVEGVVVVAAHDGAVVGLDAATGAERWRLAPEAVGPGGAQHAAAPVAVGTDVVVADSNGRVRHIDARTGAVSRTWQAAGPVLAVPAVSGNRLAVPTTRGVVSVIDLGTSDTPPLAMALGALGRTRTSVAAVTGGGFVAAGSNGQVVRMSPPFGRSAEEIPSTPAADWTVDVRGGVAGTPLVVGGVVYVGTTDRQLVALDLATGAEVWRTATRGRVKSAAAVGNGTLVVLTEPRHVAAYGAPGRISNR